jgi:restriction endonuclease S subunit
MLLIFGDEKMAVFSVIKLSELERAKRIDAEYYKPEYLELKQKLLQTKFVYFRDLVKEIIHPKEIKREYENEKKDYLFLLAQNVRSLMLDFSERKYISEEKAKQMPKNLLEKGDILFIRTGAVGDSAVYIGEPPKVISSAHILIAKPNFRVSPYYLAVFFNTSLGKNLIIRGAYGALQPEVSPNYIKSIPVPVLSKDLMIKTEELFFKSQDLLKQSYTFYSQAENLLLEELGLKDFKPRYEKTYTANLSSAFSAYRVDAEYFQPAYEEVVRKIKEYPSFGSLLKFVENIEPKFDPTKYPEKNFSYVELSDIDSSIGIIHSINEIKGQEAPSRARRILKKNDVIVSSVEGSLEKVALVDKEHDGCLASTGFFQFRPLNILPEVLLVLSKTIVLQLQLKKKCSGTILTAVPKESLRDIVIPLLPLETQQKIASLVQQSHEARRKAKNLLEEAKRKVEEVIENEISK